MGDNGRRLAVTRPCCSCVGLPASAVPNPSLWLHACRLPGLHLEVRYAEGQMQAPNMQPAVRLQPQPLGVPRMRIPSRSHLAINAPACLPAGAT